MFGDNLERIVAAIEKNYEADEIFFTKPGRRFPSRTAIKGLKIGRASCRERV